MSHPVKIKVRPNQTVRFPGICVHCQRPAMKRMGLKKRIGRVTRMVDVPLCADCWRELNRLSGEEERWQQIGRLFAGLLSILILAFTLLLTPEGMSFFLRLFVALFAALLAARFVLSLSRRIRRKAALPAKQAIRQSASILNFSWRATTFDFVNETFAERFKDLNEAILMEV